MPGHGLGTRSQTDSECSLKQKLKLELLRGSRPKLESLPVSVVVHEHLVRAGCVLFGTATRRTLTGLHRPGKNFQRNHNTLMCCQSGRSPFSAKMVNFAKINSSNRKFVPVGTIPSNQTSFLFLSDKCELTAGSHEKNTAQPRRCNSVFVPPA